MLYVYAICDAGAQVQVPGLREAEVRPLRVGDLDFLVSEHDHIEPSADVDELWTHEAVVESAGEGDRGVLPLRMGSVMPDEHAVRALVERRASEFARALERVRGAVELGVRAAIADVESQSDAESEAGGGPGTAYLMDRLARKRRGDEVIDLVHRPLAVLAREHVRLDRTLGDPASVRFAYLVDKDAVVPFQARVQELDTRLDNVRLVCTGPWPPYSFAEGRVE